MNRAALLLVLCLPLTAQDGIQPRVLFMTHSAGFEHPVVRRVEAGKLALAEHALVDAAAPHFEIVASQDPALLAPDSLAGFDGIVFYTTGTLPIPAPHATALIEWVGNGGGFVGVHSATDTFHDLPAYTGMIGGVFDGHPWHQEVGVVVERPDHPTVAHLGDRFTIRDEIYQFRDWRRDAQTVLLSLDPASVDLDQGKRTDGDYALAWSKEIDAGRLFYTALGHQPEVWADPRFVRMLIGALHWVTDAGSRWSKPPAGATVLFDGTSTAAWQHADGAECRWRVVDGALEIVPGSGSLLTRDAWTDFVLHLEFALPEAGDEVQGQARSNSGVYLHQRYEVQILDSGRERQADGCAAVYRQRAPDVAVAGPAGAWQDFWIRFRAPRFGDDGTKTANARITLWHNGVLVHDDVELPAKTGAGRPEGPQPLPLLLQDHGAPVRFRNVWVLESE